MSLVFICAEDSGAEFGDELQGLCATGACTELTPLVWRCDWVSSEPSPRLVFCRQMLPESRQVTAQSISAWTAAVFKEICERLPDGPWRLHVVPEYGNRTIHRLGARAWHTASRAGSHDGTKPFPESRDTTAEAGLNRCSLIEKNLLESLKRKRRGALRSLRHSAEPFTAEESLVQVLLLGPETGFISVAAAPLPYEQRQLISPFPKGAVPLEWDKEGPSRASCKLREALLRLGIGIQAGQTCVDLGASPGSWTWFALKRGAIVTAVDRSPLRLDLMSDSRVRFHKGDAFAFVPPKPVDWLLCDVIAPAEDSSELLVEWLTKRQCRNFVVTLKMQEKTGRSVIEALKMRLQHLSREWRLMRLCANKKEICAFGVAAD